MIAEHTQTTTEAPIVLQCVDLCKCYNGVVQASDHINFTLRRGEVHAFLGENGAGKSTLMKMLYGIEQPDEGQMFLSGEPVVLKSPADAIAHGIGMVHQELMLIPHLTVAENITLGQEVRTRCGRLKKQEASRSIRELAASYGLDIDPDALVDKLTIGQRQRVEIVKLLYRKADILIFDEPTALLTPQESDALFDVPRRLRELGKSTIFITHKSCGGPSDCRPHDRDSAGPDHRHHHPSGNRHGKADADDGGQNGSHRAPSAPPHREEEVSAGKAGLSVPESVARAAVQNVTFSILLRRVRWA
ncbi:MAG: ATP-binding cassette domain-containing protein [Dysosmobacter sp.]